MKTGISGSQGREQLVELCQQLAGAAGELDASATWPRRQLELLREAGVYRWFIAPEYGGWGWSEPEIVEGYLALSQACLTTTFVLTQWNAACKRIQGSANNALKQRLLPQLADGKTFATVGISHLTTSRQHLSEPVLKAAIREDGSVELNGFSPWVTGAPAADILVVGGVCADGNQVLCAVPQGTNGVSAKPGAALVALTGSCTDRVDFDGVLVGQEMIVSGPVGNVLATNAGGAAGGLQTSTLAIGLAAAAADFLLQQAAKRADLMSVAEKINADCQELRDGLMALAAGSATDWTPASLRGQANSLVLRSTQAALSAAKGAGYLSSHPAGRWAREALFFLVWSCPQPVVDANLCELAQLEGS